MVELQADDKKRADESRIKIQIAQIEAAKEQAKIHVDQELKIKEMELQAQQAKAQASTNLAATPTPHSKDAKSPKLPFFIDDKDELDSYLLYLERYAEIEKLREGDVGY